MKIWHHISILFDVSFFCSNYFRTEKHFIRKKAHKKCFRISRCVLILDWQGGLKCTCHIVTHEVLKTFFKNLLAECVLFEKLWLYNPFKCRLNRLYSRSIHPCAENRKVILFNWMRVNWIEQERLARFTFSYKKYFTVEVFFFLQRMITFWLYGVNRDNLLGNMKCVKR